MCTTRLRPQHVHADGHSFTITPRRTPGHSDGRRSFNVKASTALEQTPGKTPHSSDGQCCGLMCVTALPAALIDIVTPSAPTALCEVEGYRKVTDNAPPRLYRPPIS